MSEQASARRRRNAMAAARYERYQQDIRSGRPRPLLGPRPREFDESGFPIAQGDSSFIERVTRLLRR